ncbi:MAG: universal stress protein [Chryseolinea sp.]
MMQHVLIPTDFTIESLNLLKAAATMNTRPKRIILFHAVELTDSITELLFFSKSAFIESISNKDFVTASKIIHNRYASTITSVEIDLFIGRGHRAFENFVAGNGVDLIVIPEAYTFRMPSNRSVDPLRFIHRTGKRIRMISWKRRDDVAEDSLSGIFQFDPELKATPTMQEPYEPLNGSSPEHSRKA